MADFPRSSAEREAARYGGTVGARGDYGRSIAESLGDYMAECAVEDSVRELWAVGLVATVGGGDEGVEGCLWLVDRTGAYPCRAHAVGCGADRINRRLIEVSDTKGGKEGARFEDLSVEEGARFLLDLITDEIRSSGNDDGGGGGVEDEGWRAPPEGSRVEIAVVESGQRKMRRLRQPFGLERSVPLEDE